MQLWVALCLAVATASAPAWSADLQDRHADPKRRVDWLLNPSRDEAFRPDEVVAALALKPGEVVADIGSGPGYFTLRFARAVAPDGRVYGVDIEPHFLEELGRFAALSGLSNVVPVLTAPDSPSLPPASIDLAFLSSVYRHITDRPQYLGRLRPCLKPGGRVAILEWRKASEVHLEKPPSRRFGPPEEEKIDPELVVRELREAGFAIVQQPEFLEYHFFLIARVSGERHGP